MTTSPPDTHPLVVAYLADLERVLAGSDPQERADTLAAIREHIADALDGAPQDTATTMAVLADLGPVERIAATATPAAANQWNYYQAKSSRQNLAELATHIPGVDAAHYKDEIERYKSQKEDVRKQAEKLEATSKEWDQKSEEALHQHHRWAQAMTAIQIAISLAAITLLTRKEWLKRMSYTAGGVAVVLGGLAWLHL